MSDNFNGYFCSPFFIKLQKWPTESVQKLAQEYFIALSRSVRCPFGVGRCSFFHVQLSAVIWVLFPKNRGIWPPKWMVKIMGNPYSNWWFRGSIIFGNTYISKSLQLSKTSKLVWAIISLVPSSEKVKTTTKHTEAASRNEKSFNWSFILPQMASRARNIQ